MIEKMLQKDLFIKITAVVIALLVWWTVRGMENPVTTKAITVDLKIEIPEDKVLSQPIANTRVTITFEGRDRSLERIKAEDIVVPIDISKAPAGLSTIPIEYASPYQGVKVISVNPNTVTIPLDTLDNKDVGIFIDVHGTPNKEFDAEKPSYTEQKVTVTGPRSNVGRVQVVAGEIDVTGAVAATTARVALVPKDAYGNEIAQLEVQPSEIEVTVPMKPKLPAKTVQVKVVTIGTPKKGYKLAGATVAPERVVIRGDALVTRKIDALPTGPVNVDGKEAGFTSSVNLVLPSGVSLETTSKVAVSIDIQPDIVSKTFSNVYVQLENLPIGFTFGIEPRQVDVKLTGRSDILEQIKSTDVQAFINAVDTNPSPIESKQEYQLWVTWGTLPEGITVDIYPSRVTLTLTKRL